MPRSRGTPRSRSALEKFDHPGLLAEIDSLTDSILNGNYNLTSDALIECVLKLQSILDTQAQSNESLTKTSRKNQRSSSEIGDSSRDEWEHARKRVRPKISDDDVKGKLHGMQDLAAAEQCENVVPRVQLPDSEQQREDHRLQQSIAQAGLHQIAAAERTATEFSDMPQQEVQAKLDRSLEVESLSQRVLPEVRIETLQKEGALEMGSENS